MILHNIQVTGSLVLNGVDLNDVTGSEASVAALNEFTSSQESLNTTLATTGSNQFNGLQSISGSVNIEGGTIISSSGDIVLKSNAVISTLSGDIRLQPFDDIRLYGGDGTNGGDVVLRGGNATGTNTPGDIGIYPGYNDDNTWGITSIGNDELGRVWTFDSDTGELSLVGDLVFSDDSIQTTAFVGTATSSSYAATASFADSFTVAGEIVAQTLNVQQVTSSVVYSSGSNVFGNDISNTQQFTGSLQVSGSNHYMLGNLGLGTDSPAGKLNIVATGADGLVLSPDLSDANNSARIFFTRTGGEGWALMNNASILSVRSGAIPGTTSGTQKLGITTDGVATFACQTCTPHSIASNNLSIGSNCTSTSGYNTRLRITDIANDTFVFAFNNQACKPIMYMYGGNTVNPQGYTAWLDNTSDNLNHVISHNTAEDTYFASQGGNVGIGTSTLVTTCTNGALTIVKKHNLDTPPSPTAQCYYCNQSGLYVFGRNSGISIISSNNEEGRIQFSNQSSEWHATIGATTLNSPVGGTLYFRTGACTNNRFYIDNTGISYFSCQVCAPTVVVDNCVNIGTSTSLGSRLSIESANDQAGVTMYNSFDCNKWSLRTGTPGVSNKGFAIVDDICNSTRIQIDSTGNVGIGATSPCSLLNVHCASNGGDSLYTNMFTITTDVSSTFNHLAFSPTSIEFRREAQTGVDFCIRTLVCNGSSGGNIVFAPNLDGQSMCSYPRMKIQQNGFIGIGAACAQTYLHVCDNLSTGRDDLIRLQTTVSTNHAWLKSISCGGVTSIFGSNRANTDGNLIANHAVAGTTSTHNFDLISNSTVRVRLSAGGAVCLLGNSNDYPTLFLAGPTYTMVAIGDRSSSAGTDVGYISVYNQGALKIDLPGNADPIVFNNGGPMIAGRAYASGDPSYGYQFLEFCNGATWHGPLALGNSGGGISQAPLYCSGGGKRWAFGWNSADMNSITNYNNCTPFLLNWGINGDDATIDRKFCFNYDGNAYASGGTWGTLSSNCIIKTCITGASSQWNDVKNICIVNYKMKEEVEEYGTAARIHLGVVAEQVAEVSPGLLEQGAYSCKWDACLNGVKTSILHMKAVKALQEAMNRIEILESCLGIV